VGARAWHEGCETLDECERVEGDGGSAVAPRMAQAIDDTAVLAQREALGGDRWAGDVA
jgi:hypothetical protein